MLCLHHERQPDKNTGTRQTEPACGQGLDVWRPSHGADRGDSVSKDSQILDSTACAKTAACIDLPLRLP